MVRWHEVKSCSVVQAGPFRIAKSRQLSTALSLARHTNDPTGWTGTMGAFVAIKRARSIQERSGVRLGLPSILEGHSARGRAPST